MAIVTINHNGKAYLVDNGNNAKGMKYDNPGGGSQRTYKVSSFNADIDGMTYQLVFKEVDTDDVSGYESKTMGNRGVSGAIDSGWLSVGKLDIKLMKIDAVNILLRQLEPSMDENPLTTTGSVVLAFQ